MLLRRSASCALVVYGVAACQPDVGFTPTTNAYAAFDLTAPEIPLPNDLALQQAATTPGAQGELLRAFVAAGGFPNDQEVPVTFDLVQVATASSTRTAPSLDLTSVRICPSASCNVAIIALTAPSPGFPAVDPPAAADYVAGGDHGTLTLHRSLHSVPSGSPGSTIQSRRWDAGVHYVAALRSGANGVTVNGGQQIYVQPTMFLLEQGQDLRLPQNQGLIPGATNAEKARLGAQLEQIRTAYESGPFQAVGIFFPKTEIAAITTFQIAPQGAGQPVIDASAGVVPLPSNLLLDGTTLPEDPLAPATNARVQNVPAFGALAPGLATLDGFSTTAMQLIPTSSPIVVALGSATPVSTFANNVFLYDVSDPNNPVRVDPATYDDLLPSAARSETSSGSGVWASALVGLQPAAASKLSTSKPLKEATEYAVVVTKRIATLPTQAPLGRPSVGEIVLFDNPVYANGKSLLAGVPVAQAKVLERMRAQIAKVLPKLQALPPPATTAKADIALAFTFRTQTITTPALQLAAAPYSDATKSQAVVPGAVTVLPPIGTGSAFEKYGIESTIVASNQILQVLETTVPTSNLLSPTTGSFDPTLLQPGASPPVELLKVLIAVPLAANVSASCPAPANALKCAPLVVFHHGLNGGRAQMLLGANELAAKGFVVAAIDAPKHGDRAFCAGNADCTGGTPTCTPIGPPGTQGDTTPPGTCTNGALKKKPLLCTTTNCNTFATDGIPTFPSTGGNAPFLISANLFRTRDSFRQDIIDHSNLILALARPPPPALPGIPATTVATELASQGIAINPAAVLWEGQSLGGILGTVNLAANPRITEAVLNVPGGTFVDIAATSPAFAPGINALLASLTPPITPNTPEYLQFLQVAKWVLDPAESINFAGRLLGDAAHPTLPNLLATGAPPQVGKKVLGQLAVCDNVVPNPFNLLLFNVAGLVQGQANGYQIFSINVAGGGTPAPNGDCLVPQLGTGTVAHGFLLDHGATASFNQAHIDLSQLGRNDAAAFLFDFLTNPNAMPPPPVEQKP